MDYEMAKRIDVQPVTLQKSLNITAVDGSPLGTGKVSQCTPPLQLQIGQHQKQIQFFSNSFS